ncbi:MAG: glutamyl aminopeptidase [Candidatus Cloacimonetes bacterium HGW-Cloacimonetes-1]|jgi:hypothetical protein|nr:MAG: glutamyl aminopeptidase [Candidatus Cloacimonetes bacterium HGW-Cloacimonetes-1]
MNTLKKHLLIVFIILGISTLLAGSNDVLLKPEHKAISPLTTRMTDDVLRWTSARADSAHGFDVQKYDLTLSINDQTHVITGNVIATVIAETNLSSIQYNLNSLTVTQVMVDNQPVTFTHQNGLITIPLNVTTGQTFTTQVFYNGIPTLTPNSYQIGMIFSANTVFTISDPDATRQWMPCYDYPWDKAIMDLHITMRSDWKVAANGIRTEIVNNGNGTSTTHWIGSNPMTTYLVCITAGPYVEINQTAGAVPIQNFVMQNQYNNALIDFAPLPSILNYYSQIFGAYPFEKYGQAAVSMSTYGAMEHQTMTTLGNYIITGNHAYELTIAHELAHQWFGDAVSFLTFKDVWLSESFATYAEQLWMDKRDGWAAACSYVNSSFHQYYLNYENSYGVQTIYNPAYNNYFTPPSYEKGASVLHMLRYKIGDAAFFSLLQNWFQTYRDSNAITAEFQAMAEQISGQNLTQFFQQWIFAPGIPSVEYSLFTKSNPAQLKVYAKTTSPTATAFSIEFPLHVQTSVGADSLYCSASPTGVASTFDFLSLSSITSSSVDPNHWILLRGKTEVKPVVTECLTSSGAVLLFWAAFNNCDSYNIYRRIGTNGQWQLLNTTPTVGLDFQDTTVSNGTNYQYAIKAVDAQGFESMFSNVMTATPVAFSFAHNLLVVDETKDGNGAAINPNDVMVDDFYSGALAPMSFDTWDYATQGALPLEVLGQYRVVVWHDDDLTQHFIADNLSALGGYILGGGKLVISGWKTPASITGAWLNRFAGNPTLVYDNAAVLISAQSDTYPTLTVDPAKLTTSWNGRLPMIYTFNGADTSLYTADMLDGSLGDGLPAAIRSDNNGSLVMFGFPLYFMQADGVRALLQQLLPELNSALPIADEAIPSVGIKVGIFPNPFSTSLTIDIHKEQSTPLTAAIYNIKGQLIRTLHGNTELRQQLTWDGRDYQGSAVSSGIYFVQIKDSYHTHTQKIIHW